MKTTQKNFIFAAILYKDGIFLTTTTTVLATDKKEANRIFLDTLKTERPEHIIVSHVGEEVDLTCSHAVATVITSIHKTTQNVGLIQVSANNKYEAIGVGIEKVLSTYPNCSVSGIVVQEIR